MQLCRNIVNLGFVNHLGRGLRRDQELLCVQTGVRNQIIFEKLEKIYNRKLWPLVIFWRNSWQVIRLGIPANEYVSPFKYEGKIDLDCKHSGDH